MRYAHIVDGAIVALGPLPDIERAPERDWDLRDPIIRAARGWYEITETPRPDDTATTTWERSVTLVAGVPTVTWMERPWTAEELAAQAEQSAREAGRALVKAIVLDLRAEKDRAQAVIDDAGATKNEKNLGRAIKRTADAAIDLARFVAP